MVDAGYKTDIIHDPCRHSVYASVLMPSRGLGIGAAGKPIAEYNRNIGDQIGFNWFITRALDRTNAEQSRFGLVSVRFDHRFSRHDGHCGDRFFHQVIEMRCRVFEACPRIMAETIASLLAL